MTEAFAVGFINTTQTPAVVTGVGIYGTDAGSTCTDLRVAYPFDVSAMCGDNWDDAVQKLTAHLAKFYPWAHALLGPEHRKAVQ